MKPELQRIAIAKACRIEVIPCTCSDNPWKDASTGKHIPDYLNDLNAMAQAEEGAGFLKDDFRGRKLRRTWFRVMRFIGLNEPAFATAAQRAESFLRTLGFWEEA